MIMKQKMKLNQQLAITLLVLILGSIMAFGVILPISIKYFIDHKNFNILISEQNEYIKLGKYYNTSQGKKNGVYHLQFDSNNNLVIDQTDDDLIHHQLMYPEFFSEIKEQCREQKKQVEMRKFIDGQENLYYLINNKDSGEKVISYSIDTGNQYLSHQLFMTTLIIIIVALTIILVSFFKWNNRFINNLKQIQRELDLIGDGQLEESICINESTLEFQEVMDSLEHMRRKLYNNEQTKKRMIHNISHDLKTPIAVIKNYSEGIIDGVYPYGDVEQTAHVIYSQAERLEKRVQGLLYLNRLEYIRSQNESYREFAIDELLEEVVSYMFDQDQLINVRLDLVSQRFIGDKEKWRIVLENLFDNAKRYAKNEISIKLTDQKLSIFNDGDNIEEDLAESLFEPFEIGKDGMSGLGLAIVKRTVNMYGYDIRYENAETKGVTFIIYKDGKANE